MPEDLIGVFQGTVKGGYNYARQGTPTSAALEAKVTALEQGTGSICFATGMAAITASLLTLLRAGDHMVSSRYVFGRYQQPVGHLAPTWALASAWSTPAPWMPWRQPSGPRRAWSLSKSLPTHARRCPIWKPSARCASSAACFSMVDNTVTSPALFQPRTVGAGLVINSLTKTLAGHGAALGGAVTDTGLFDWSRWPNIFESYRKGDPAGWGLQQIRKKGLRDMGAPLAPEAAHQISVGSETLALRVERTSATAPATGPAPAGSHRPWPPSTTRACPAIRSTRSRSACSGLIPALVL